MNKPGLVRRLKVLEQKKGISDKIIVLKMWCPDGKTTHSNTGRVRIEPSTPEDAKL